MNSNLHAALTARASTIAPKPLLGRAEAAKFLTELGLNSSKKSLEKAAWCGGGPPYRRYGKRVLYTPSDLLEHAQDRLSAPAASAAEHDDLATRKAFTNAAR